MSPSDALHTVILPAMALLPPHMNTKPAQVILVAIASQESKLKYRRQLGNGPARGLWQNELGGAVTGVFQNHQSHELVRQLCQFRDVNFSPRAIWGALEDDDFLAAGIARLTLWCDPKPLPEPGDVEGGWGCYLFNWRPGKPRPDDWPANYQAAMEAVFPKEG
jgi:hypothetical protein